MRYASRMSLDREMELALSAARAASEVVASVYGREFSVACKLGDDPITEADRASNELLVDLLQKSFPDDAVCAEESDLDLSARAAARGGRCWFVDPLDGTREFVRRSGEFCIMLGLSIAGRPKLGVVVAPAWRRTFAGSLEPGEWQGAWEISWDQHRRPLRLPQAPPAHAARLVLSRLHRNQVVESAAKQLGIQVVRECGSTGLKFMLVAAGEVDLYLHTGPGPSLWDGCAGEAIALAAGATVSDAAGRPLRYDTGELPLSKGLVVGAPSLCAATITYLAELVNVAGDAHLGYLA